MKAKTPSQSTLIRLPKTMLEKLKYKGVKEGKSVACLVREAIEAAYGIAVEERGADPHADPFTKLIGSCDTGIKNGSRRHDRDIYGVE